MAMVQAVIPQMRERRSGIIVNVTSRVTLAAMPLAAAYMASKQVIEGFTGLLAYQLAYFELRAKVVELGYAPTKSFGQNSSVRGRDPCGLCRFRKTGFRGICKPCADNKGNGRRRCNLGSRA